MASYLSPEWFKEMEEAARNWAAESSANSPAASPEGEAPSAASASDEVAGVSTPDVKELRIAERITGTPFGDVEYVVAIGNDLKITQTSVDGADAHVTFIQNYETSVAMHKGDLSTHQALFDGKLRVSGNLNALLENDETVRGVAPVFATVREQTSY